MGTLSGCAEAVHGVMVRTGRAGPEWVWPSGRSPLFCPMEGV